MKFRYDILLLYSSEREVIEMKVLKSKKSVEEEEFYEVYSSSNMRVVMRNCLALGVFPDMNLEQEKLLGIALANAHSKEDFYYYRCELTKLARMIGYDDRNTTKLREALLKDKFDELRDFMGNAMMPYVIVKDGNKIIALSLFTKVVFENVDGKIFIIFRLNDDLRPYVLKQTGNFCVLALDLYTKSTSPYSIRLGRALSALLMKGEKKDITFTKEQLASLLKLPKFYQDNFYETKRIILKRAVREVNCLDNGVTIEHFERIADGRSYKGVMFVARKD